MYKNIAKIVSYTKNNSKLTWRTDRLTDERTCRQTDRQTDRETDVILNALKYLSNHTPNKYLALNWTIFEFLEL